MDVPEFPPFPLITFAILIGIMSPDFTDGAINATSDMGIDDPYRGHRPVNSAPA